MKRIVVEVARDTAVLNADDPLCLKMADYTEAKHLCYVTMNPTHELVREHIRAGGRGVVLETGDQRPDDHDLRPRRPHPAALDAPDPGDARGPGDAQRAERDVRRRDGVHAWASSSRTSATGSAPSTPRSSRRPGRMNVFDEHPFKVILDYGHNPAAVEAMAELVERLEVTGRRIVRAGGARRPARRGHRARSAGSRRGTSTATSAGATTTCAAAQPDEVPQLLRDGAARRTACRPSRSW